MSKNTPEVCGFCEQGERPVRQWNSRAMFHETTAYEPCPYCDGTGYVQEVGRAE